MTRPQHQAGRHADSLVTRAGDLEKNLVLALELDLFIVETPRKQHCAVSADQLICSQAAGALALGSGLCGHSPANSPCLRGDAI